MGTLVGPYINRGENNMETITIIAGTLLVVIVLWLVWSVKNLNGRVEDIDTLSMDIVDINSSMDTRFEKMADEVERRLNTVHNKMHQLNDDLNHTIEKIDDKLTSFEKIVKETSKKY